MTAHGAPAPSGESGSVWSPEILQPQSSPVSITSAWKEGFVSYSNLIPEAEIVSASGGDNTRCEGMGWLGPYLQRVATMPESTEPVHLSAVNSMPTNFVAWWDPLVRQPAGLSGQALPVGVDVLVQNALVHSPHVKAIETEPQIRQTQLVEEYAEFDWRSFLESKYVDTNDPVGNTLTTGNNDNRFKDQTWYASGGIRRRNEFGGEVEAKQRLGHQQNNSRFLVPQPQGTARFELNYTQPLLNGRGRPYNESRIVLAHIDTGMAHDQVVEELQEHLLKVTQAYWDLYRARSEYFQRQRLLNEAEQILANLTGRQTVDALERQVLRAQATVANRRSEIARAVTSIRNAESQLRLLVNDPMLRQSAALEFVPGDCPLAEGITVSVRDGLSTALRNRPDISQAIRTLSATSVRMGVAKHELLPQLDLLMSTYVAGLEGDSRVFSAYGNQFADGRPGFAVGLQFEFPAGNRAARARVERRKWEMTKAANEFRATVEQSLTETEIAIREVHTTYREMQGKFEAMTATDRETLFLVDRWKTLPDLDDSATLLLEDLLDSQARRAEEESAFVQAQVNYAVALVRMRKVTGTLLRCDPIVAEPAPTTTAPIVTGETDALPPPSQISPSQLTPDGPVPTNQQPTNSPISNPSTLTPPR